jgi:PAS domain-containing protein
MATLSVLGLSSLSLAIGRLRHSSAELQQRASALESEITERQRVEEALQESEEKYRHIINAAADSIISLDKRGLVCQAAETLRHNRGQRFSHQLRFCETEHLLGGEVELAKRPLNRKDVWTIVRLQMEGRRRDLAMFNW